MIQCKLLILDASYSLLPFRTARFRIKKKQREAALETTNKELQARVDLLLEENDKLKTENSWLKGLITVRGDGKGKEASNSNSSDELQDDESNESHSVEDEEMKTNSNTNLNEGITRSTRSTRNSKGKNEGGIRSTGLVARGVGTNGRTKRDRED